MYGLRIFSVFFFPSLINFNFNFLCISNGVDWRDYRRCTLIIPVLRAVARKRYLQNTYTGNFHPGSLKYLELSGHCTI